MKTWMAVAGGAVIGAGAALLFAPQTGRATRAMLRDRTTKCTHDFQEFVDGKARHFRNKASGYRRKAEDLAERMGMGAEDGMADPAASAV